MDKGHPSQLPGGYSAGAATLPSQTSPAQDPIPQTMQYATYPATTYMYSNNNMDPVTAGYPSSGYSQHSYPTTSGYYYGTADASQSSNMYAPTAYDANTAYAPIASATSSLSAGALITTTATSSSTIAAHPPKNPTPTSAPAPAPSPTAAPAPAPSPTATVPIKVRKPYTKKDPSMKKLTKKDLAQLERAKAAAAATGAAQPGGGMASSSHLGGGAAAVPGGKIVPVPDYRSAGASSMSGYISTQNAAASEPNQATAYSPYVAPGMAASVYALGTREAIAQLQHPLPALDSRWDPTPEEKQRVIDTLRHARDAYFKIQQKVKHRLTDQHPLLTSQTTHLVNAVAAFVPSEIPSLTRRADGLLDGHANVLGSRGMMDDLLVGDVRCDDALPRSSVKAAFIDGEALLKCIKRRMAKAKVPRLDGSVLKVVAIATRQHLTDLATALVKAATQRSDPGKELYRRQAVTTSTPWSDIMKSAKRKSERQQQLLQEEQERIRLLQAKKEAARLAVTKKGGKGAAAKDALAAAAAATMADGTKGGRKDEDEEKAKKQQALTKEQEAQQMRNAAMGGGFAALLAARQQEEKAKKDSGEQMDIEEGSNTSSSSSSSRSGSSSSDCGGGGDDGDDGRPVKRLKVTMEDVIAVMEADPVLRRSPRLLKAYLR